MKKELIFVLCLMLFGCGGANTYSYAWCQANLPHETGGHGEEYIEFQGRPYVPAYSGYQGSNFYGSYGYHGNTCSHGGHKSYHSK